MSAAIMQQIRLGRNPRKLRQAIWWLHRKLEDMEAEG